jgi:hypothetical protein
MAKCIAKEKTFRAGKHVSRDGNDHSLANTTVSLVAGFAAPQGAQVVMGIASTLPSHCGKELGWSAGRHRWLGNKTNHYGSRHNT